MTPKDTMPRKVRSYKEIDEAVKRAGDAIPGIRITDLGPISTPAASYPFYVLDIGPGPEAPLSVYLSGGIHGDEPGGVWALMEFLRRYPSLDPIYKDVHFTVLPCINPTGYELDTRENAGGFDLNRQFRRHSPPAEVARVKKAVGGRAYDLTLEFHEDVDTPGFYLYELTQQGEPSWGREIIDRVSKKFPVNKHEEIEDFAADGGLIYRSGGQSGGENDDPGNKNDDFNLYIRSREEWPQAFYHFTNGGAHCYTTETPVTLSREERAEIHLSVLDSALRLLWEQKSNQNR